MLFTSGKTESSRRLVLCKKLHLKPRLKSCEGLNHRPRHVNVWKRARWHHSNNHVMSPLLVNHLNVQYKI